MSIPAFARAVEMARDLRGYETSSVELLENLLDRISNYNPPLNALVTIDAESARQRAREADQALARGNLGTAARAAGDGQGRVRDARPALHRRLPAAG